MNRPHRTVFLVLGVFAALGILFSAVSVFDFIAHLDRQVHAITCSFIPGVGAADSTGSSGCHAALMSPYSSLFRTMTWGGVPIALMSLGVFGYLLFLVADLWILKQETDREETLYLVAATLLPVLASVVYYLIATFKVGALCKLCIGIYISSLGVFIAAVLAHRMNRVTGASRGRFPVSHYLFRFGEGVLMVALPVAAYLALKPAHGTSATGCGELIKPEDKYGVRVKLGGPAVGRASIEVLDPLCAACKNFSARLEASGLDQELQREVVLFPLDKECNWMVSQTIHPGACLLSEAVMCAEGQASSVLAWTFDHQEELRSLASDPKVLEARIKEEFPSVANCLGKPAVKARLNKSLRWVVSNSLPVLTPQLYVEGRKLCDEDTDLGLEYSLTRLLSERTASSAAAPSSP